MRTILPLACILLVSAALPACSSSKPDAQSAAAATAAPVTAAAPADADVTTAAPAAASGDATAAAVASDATAAPVAGDCPLIGSDAVAKVMHLEVKSVEVKSDPSSCTFHFKGDYHGDIDVSYSTSGGADQLSSVRTASGAVKSMFGALLKGASAPPGSIGAISATPPPDVAKVGDDQAFANEGPVTQFYATHGDGYVEVDGGFFPEGVTGWTALPEIARQIIASR
jgi:hypothetical protein